MFFTFKLKHILIALGAVVLIVLALILLLGGRGNKAPAIAATAAPIPSAGPRTTSAPERTPPRETGERLTARPYTLVIDAGHGGEDGGSSSPTQHEADVNLDIALRMQALAGLYGVVPVMTRESADIAYPSDLKSVSARKVWDQKQRVALINGTQNALLISIHQNTFPSPIERGAQVLYAKTGGSAELAALLQEALRADLDPGNRRVAMPISGTIYLMKSVNCPAVLVECGFLSNAGEDAKLADGNYRLKLAAVILNTYFQYSG